MKQGLHPKYEETTVTCACGNTFTTRSTRQNLRTDLCNVCHPFYTGEQRIVDTAGQVERFTRRMEAANAGQKSKRQRRLEARRQAQATPVSESEAMDEATEDIAAQEESVEA